MNNISTRLEVNLLRNIVAASDMNHLGNFMIKYSIPAVVVDPNYIEHVMMERLAVGGKYKIICAVDFDTGRRFACEKMRPLPRASLGADGFDILLSAGRADKEAYNELKTLNDFIRENLGREKEIRWTFGFRVRTHESMKVYMPYLQTAPATYLRTDYNFNSPDVTAKTHLDDIAYLRQHSGTPIKVGGGGITLKSIEEIGVKAARFDVTIMEARDLIRQAEKLDDEERDRQQAQYENPIAAEEALADEGKEE